MTSADDTLTAWAVSQTSHWLGTKPNYVLAEQEYFRSNARDEDMFLFKFERGSVRILPKPHYSEENVRDGINEHLRRAARYLNFFQLVVATHSLEVDGILAMPMHDGARDHQDFPYFAFQKHYRSRAILVPDIDAIGNRFYTGTFLDTLQFSDKKASAVFVGATTGSRHTEDSVRGMRNQRIRAGVFFRDHPRVDFRLPRIVQCDSPSTEQMIRELGFGVGAANWDEQFRHKFVISMDGNGATCSRVAIALKSNSVLLKYYSEHILYYFDGLIPYLHYIPIFDDLDIDGVIAAEDNCPGVFSHIARASRLFFEEFLSAGPSLLYTAKLLAMYFSCFDTSTSTVLHPSAMGGHRDLDRRTDQTPSLLATLHVRNRGDVMYPLVDWAGDMGSGLAVEGFSLIPIRGLLPTDIEYGIIEDSEAIAQWSKSGEFVGTRAKSAAVFGFAIRVIGPAADVYDCEYSGAFVGGEIVGPLPGGATCKSANGQALEALKVTLALKRVSL